MMAAVTADDVAFGVDLALRAAHEQHAIVGRILHPVEVRWVVRWAFRARFADRPSQHADQYADQMIEVIRLQQQSIKEPST